ncbi:MAG: YbaN family protein [Niameybacter sp.]|uniref:YbaN family protein n=1 Tax=Niameybacter sp. TaxID=2033640 RepID=UPI002FC83093
MRGKELFGWRATKQIWFKERKVKTMKKTFYIVFGFLAFGLGALGVVLPILPTTPFLLIASFCFFRGSERINQWFVRTSIYKKYLESFIQDRTLTRKQKIGIPVVVSVMLLIPCILVNHLVMRIVLLIIIGLKWYYFIFKIKTRPE